MASVQHDHESVHAGYDPTPDEQLEAARVWAVMDAERYLGLTFGPTAEDEAWWLAECVERTEREEARAAAEWGILRADRAAAERAMWEREGGAAW